MALIKAETAQGFSRLPALRQIGLMVGLAASVALGVAVVLWSQTPTYSLLYGNLSDQDSAKVLEALQQAQIPYKLEQSTGAIMVPAADVHKARLKLASQGLPKGAGVGFELLQKQQELGTSQFLEQARYQHAMEVELARSISSLSNVNSARVHLAIPKRSVFLRKQEQPTASVVLALYPGRVLEEEQVAAIVHLVASSIANLSPDKVTVVDQSGRLLTRRVHDQEMALSSSQFDYTRRLEETYIKRIEDLLSPIVGRGRVRAQVVADLDFTMTEQTRESYDPDHTAVRSEQVVEEKNDRSASGGGVPGMLSNEPPDAGTTAAPAETQQGDSGKSVEQAGSSSRRSTRNFEVDKTISHTRTPLGTIRKISVAVVLDDRQTVSPDGQVVRTPLTDKEIAQITALVKDAVGFDAQRGDSVNVINSAFQVPPAPEPLPKPPLWEQPWAQDLVKQVLGGVVVLLLIFGVLRPVLRGLAEKGAHGRPVTVSPDSEGVPMGEDQLTLSNGQQSTPKLAAPSQYEDRLSAAKSLAAQDPGRVAQVVKNWVANDG
jgi:flagellar M-ring protein FliF